MYTMWCAHGRFMMTWATMSVTVSTVGKLRYNTEASRELGKFSGAIDKETLWPDAWKVAVEIKELSPNNFNMYADYYLNGFNADELIRQQEESGIWEMLGEIRQMIEKKYDDMKAAYDSNKGNEDANTAIGDMMTGLKKKSDESTSSLDKQQEGGEQQQ